MSDQQMAQNSPRTKVFISYSHADRRFLDRLHIFLKPLERDGHVDWWDDTRLTPGSDWREKIKEAMDCARVALLLISADFLASDFVQQDELPPLLDAAAKNHAVILAVILQPVDFSKSKLSGFQTVNNPERPLGKLRTRADRDEVWVKVIRAIEAALNGTETAMARTDEVAPEIAVQSISIPRQTSPLPSISKSPETKEPPKQFTSVSLPQSDQGTVLANELESSIAQISKEKPLEQQTFQEETKVSLQHLSPLRVMWWRLIELWDEFKSCRLGMLALLAVCFLFLFLSQGREVLRALAEPGDLTGATNALRILNFFVALVLSGVCNWYTARFLLYFDFPGIRRRIPATASWDNVIDSLQTLLPRLLGTAPFFIIAAGFLLVSRSYETKAPFSVLCLAIVCVLLAVAFYLVLVLRRRLVGKMPTRELENFSELDRGRMFEVCTIGGVIALVSLLLFVVFTLNPIAAYNVGAGAIVFFAMSSLVTFGSILMFLSSRWQLPVFTVGVLLALLFSLFNDNHDLRTVTPTKDYTRPTLSAALKDWHDRIAKKYPGAIHPLYVVASEGGGVRAAYWTAAVLGTIQDEQPAFADHVFAISGVGGGSLGAAVFASLLPDGHDRKDFARRAESMLGQDFLSPALASMFYPDLVQRFIPFPIPYFDRGRSMELGWENAWRDTMQKAGTKNPNRFAESFLDLWASDNDYVPNLCLNGTSVERGRRVIATNLLINWQAFLDADDAIARLMPIKDQGKVDRRARPGIDLPISAAAHLSARFTYLSPAGKFPPDGTHVVDGGYFENSGATTALDILREITRAMRQANTDLGDTVPKLIMISSNPIANVPEGPKKSPTVTTEADQKRSEPSTFLEDVMAPVYALLNARDARGKYAQRALGREMEIFYENLNGKLPPNQRARVYYFSLAPAEVPLPLGWMLSNSAARAMLLELNDEGKSITTPVETWNKFAREQIVASLPAPAD